MRDFCVDGVKEPKCYKVTPVDYRSEEFILDTILDLLKSELPPALAKVMDCESKPMVITEDAIDILPPAKSTRFAVLVNPASEVITPSESPAFHRTSFTFDINLIVSNPLIRCVTWELIRFKNVVGGLLATTELFLEGFVNATATLNGFTYGSELTNEGNGYRRVGAYRFTVSVTQIAN